jgi:Family of unknown function (DUF6535)
MYLRTAEEEDDRMAKRWQKNADGLLIFVSLQLNLDITQTPNQNYSPVYFLLSLHSLSQ